MKFYVDSIRRGSFFQGAEGSGATLDEDEIRQMRATYCGLITEIDECLGRVFAYLDETGQWDDTLIIFTSDHGEQLGDHHLLGKIGYNDPSFRIPLVIKDAGANSRAGEIEQGFTESIDVMPTILDWLGGDIPRTCDGCSLLPFLQSGQPENWRTELHYEYDFRDIHYSEPQGVLGVGMHDSSLCVVQDKHYKYVHFAALPPLFFDLENDPDEFTNLADDPVYAGLVRDYAQKALSWRLTHADRTLTHYRSGPQGLTERNQ